MSSGERSDAYHVDVDPLLDRFSGAIDLYPASFSGNPLHLLFLDDAAMIGRPRDFVQQLDGPALMEERRQYIVGNPPSWPFPTFQLASRPDPWLVSWRLFERFDEASQLLATQREIGRIVESRVLQADPDIVALLIVDGLSYYDLPEDTSAEPCLVDGASITEVGYRQVVGSPEISRRLFRAGYSTQLGFTYYPADPDSLAGQILAQFSGSQILKVQTFDEILECLDRARMVRGYIQIAMPGLDHLSHAHHDRPPREHYLQGILERFDKLLDRLARPGHRVLAFLTSDHGILWREHLEGRAVTVGDLLPEDAHHPRYIRGHFLRDYGRCRTNYGQNYTLLRVPCITRNLRANEWGVHGGISAWESIVPLLTRLA
jgi:hypothetical protein